MPAHMRMPSMRISIFIVWTRRGGRGVINEEATGTTGEAEGADRDEGSA